MHVNVDQPGKNRFAFSLDDFGSHRLGIGPGARIDFGNLPAAHEDSPALNDLAVADEDARSANQKSFAAGQSAGSEPWSS